FSSFEELVAATKAAAESIAKEREAAAEQKREDDRKTAAALGALSTLLSSDAKNAGILLANRSTPLTQAEVARLYVEAGANGADTVAAVQRVSRGILVWQRRFVVSA